MNQIRRADLESALDDAAAAAAGATLRGQVAETKLKRCQEELDKLRAEIAKTKDGNPLSLYTWTELFQEMASRSLTLVVLIEEETKHESDDTQCDYMFKGSGLAAMGLCRWGEKKIHGGFRGPKS